MAWMYVWMVLEDLGLVVDLRSSPCASQVAPNENDGRKLFDLILREGPSNFFAAIRNIEGPYAFVYYQASNQRIYFARFVPLTSSRRTRILTLFFPWDRDPLGRRSLLLHPPTPISPFLFLSSSGPSSDYPLNQWEEVACDS